MNILLFGDQTVNDHSLLRNLLRVKANICLSTFLDDSSFAIRSEIEKLAKPRRELIPPFQSFRDLLEKYCNDKLILPELESCFTVVAQLAQFFEFVTQSRNCSVCQL